MSTQSKQYQCRTFAGHHIGKAALWCLGLFETDYKPGAEGFVIEHGMEKPMLIRYTTEVVKEPVQLKNCNLKGLNLRCGYKLLSM